MLIPISQASGLLARSLLRYKDRKTGHTPAQPAPAEDVPAIRARTAPPQAAKRIWRLSYRGDAVMMAPPGAAGRISVSASFGAVSGIKPGNAVPVAAAGLLRMAPGPGVLTGQIDVLRRDLIEGWAHDDSTPFDPVPLIVMVDGSEVRRITAGRRRDDLAAAGIGNGCHAFSVSMPWLSPASRHVVAVRRASDGRDLLGSPGTIEPSASFDLALEQGLVTALAALDPGAEQDRVLSFLLAQTDKLLQRRARKRGGASARRPLSRTSPTPRPLATRDLPRQHALVVDNAMPGDDAGSHAILAHMRDLQALHYQVRFVIAEGPVEPDPAAEALEAEGIACCRAPYYVSIEELLQRLSDGIDIVYLHRLPDTAYFIPLVRAQLPKARILFSVPDLTHVRLAREHGLEGAAGIAPRSTAIRWTEIGATRPADAAIAQSTVEAAMLRQSVPGAAAWEWTGPERPAHLPFGQRSGLAFALGAGTAHVLDAAAFLVEEIMPLVWESHPAIECRLVGTATQAAVLRLARPGVVITGPGGDLASEWSRVRLTAAPYRFGDDVADDILRSLAAGLPCALTPIAAEGIDWPGALAGCLGVTAADLAGVIVRLHEDGRVNGAASAAGLALSAQRSDEASVQAALQAAIEGWVDLAAD